MQTQIDSEITKLKATRLSFRRPIMIFLVNQHGKVIDNPYTSNPTDTTHQITIFGKWLKTGASIRDVFDFMDYENSISGLMSGNLHEVYAAANQQYSEKIIEYHAYSILPTHYCRLSKLSDTVFLALIFSDPALPSIEHLEEPVCFFDERERLCAFNQAYLSLAREHEDNPDTLLKTGLDTLFIETPRRMESDFFRSLGQPFVNRTSPLSLERLIAAPEKTCLSKAGDNVQVANKTSDICLLTWPDELSFLDKPCMLDISYRTATGMPPLLLVGNCGFTNSNFLTPDQAGFSIGSNPDGSRLMFKRIGYLTASSGILPSVNKDKEQNLKVVLAKDYFRFMLNGQEVFSFWNRHPFRAQRQFLNLGIRGNDSLILNKLSICSIDDSRTDTSVLPRSLRFIRHPDRHFSFSYFLNPQMRESTRLLRGIILHEITDLYGRIEFEEKKGRELRQRLVRINQSPVYIGENPALKKAIHYATTVLKSTLPVLIQGETGTGKSALALWLHSQSTVAEKPLVTMDCSTIPHELFESLVFGHVKGAFTGANTDSRGLMEKANHATLYIDEIQNLSIADQAKLLHVLQERRITRMGGSETITLSIRFIISANEDLKSRVQAGTFREDLYYRISGVTLRMPPLRERLDDLPGLCAHFLNLAASDTGKTIASLSSDCYTLLASHSWPGNVRELRNVLTHAVIFSSGSVISSKDLRRAMETIPLSGGISTEEGIGRVSKSQFVAALKRHNGRVIPTARELGVTRHTVYYNFKRFNIDPKIYRTSN